MKDVSFLESWKEIASHLGRSVRTCRRWERDFGLPVHRLDEATQGRVFADARELDAWLKEKLHLAEAGREPRLLFKSLAVLPIENLTGEADNDYFADGITEVLITEMGQASQMRIISHQSVKQFKGTQKPAQEIAKTLGVEALVEGALLRTREGVRLSVNLIGTSPERHLWARLYECEPFEAATLPAQISQAVTSHSGMDLKPQVEARLTDRHACRADAYEAYLRGIACVHKSFLQADIQRALDYFDNAIALDPGFAAAYAEKAWALGQLGTFSYLAPKEAFPRQREAAQRAIGLDHGLADGYAALGHVSTVFDWDWQKADALFRRALELNPNSQRSLFYYTQYLNWMGRTEESIKLHDRLIELDPLNPESRWNLGWAFFWAGLYDRAMTVFQGLLEHAPEDHWLEMALGMTFIQIGRAGPALALCEKARVGVPVGIDPQFDCFVACIYASAGKVERARDILEQMKGMTEVRVMDFTQIALVHLALGENDDALGWFEQAYQARSPLMTYLNIAPFWKHRAADPRFQDLLRRMRFPAKV